MRVLQSILFMIAVAISNISNGQILNKVTKANGTVTAAGGTIANTAQTISTTTSIIKGIFGNKKAGANQTIFAISGIEYSDENLDKLKTAIKKVKGAKDVVTDYKDGTATISVSYKGKGTELWDEIPKNDRELFKLLQADGNSIILEYKTAALNQENTNQVKESSNEISFAVNKNDVLSFSLPNNSSQNGNNLINSNTDNIKSPYFMQFDFNENSFHLERETLEKDICSATIGGVGNTLAVTFYNAETKTGISFTIGDLLEKIKAKKYEFDSEKTNKEKSTWENSTHTKQLDVVFQPGDDKRYQIQCSTDPTFHYQGSGYLNITKLNPIKGGMVEGEFQFSFPVWKIKNGPAERQTIKSGKFRIAIQ